MGINPSASLAGSSLESTLLTSARESTFLSEDPRFNLEYFGGDEGGWCMFDSVQEWGSWSFGSCESAEPFDHYKGTVVLY